MDKLNMGELAGMVAETKVLNAEAGRVSMVEIRRRFAKRLNACRNAYNSLNNFAHENWAFLCENAISSCRDHGGGHCEMFLGGSHYDDYQYRYDLVFKSEDNGTTYHIDDETGLHVNGDNCHKLGGCYSFIYPKIYIRKIGSIEVFLVGLRPEGVEGMEERVADAERFYCDILPSLFRILMEHCRDNAKHRRDTLLRAEGTGGTDGRHGEIKKVTICVETVRL